MKLQSDIKKRGLVFGAVFAMCLLSIRSDAADIESALAAPADYLISLVRHGDRSPRDLGE
ncbi:hypothetical protein [Endozoicomonas sp. GU-1]|uniref:hypothetical protein n=1 Tax=Endozoicomonas sp. GU-1 TaxID=3009078 RepID=UPI0022B3ACD8|nr:hypothetical protein [Endozoicomonas sp. GU-1]WBA82564.1 hypothetical protein O2T12_05295 [Endozoicomonas sp. GU-1]